MLKVVLLKRWCKTLEWTTSLIIYLKYLFLHRTFCAERCKSDFILRFYIVVECNICIYRCNNRMFKVWWQRNECNMSTVKHTRNIKTSDILSCEWKQSQTELYFVLIIWSRDRYIYRLKCFYEYYQYASHKLSHTISVCNSKSTLINPTKRLWEAINL